MLLGRRIFRHKNRIASWHYNRRVTLSASRQGDSSRDSLEKTVNQYSKYRPSPLKMTDLLKMGQHPSEALAFNFVRKEVPVRISTILKEMNHLPAPLLEHRSVKLVRDCYFRSLAEIMTFEDSDMKDSKELARFRQTLSRILERHREDVQEMGRGVIEVSDGLTQLTKQEINYYLDRIYMVKIGVRMLQHQYNLVFTPKSPGEKKGTHIGAIDPGCNVTAALIDAFDDARFLCEMVYDDAPRLKVQVFKYGKKLKKNAPISIVYVPSHIHHILFELIKNAMRAQMEAGRRKRHLPLRALIYQGKDDVTIRLSDRGGGIPRKNADLVFNYAFTTAERPEIPGDEHHADRQSDPHSVALAGYGYGLPLARLYARYFSGEVVLTSIDGWGTDAYVYLQNSPINASERLTWYSPLKRVFH